MLQHRTYSGLFCFISVIVLRQCLFRLLLYRSTTGATILSVLGLLRTIIRRIISLLHHNTLQHLNPFSELNILLRCHKMLHQREAHGPSNFCGEPNLPAPTLSQAFCPKSTAGNLQKIAPSPPLGACSGCE